MSIGEISKRLTSLIGLLLMCSAMTYAQDRVQVHEAYGPARSEERILANGLVLKVGYADSGAINFFSIESDTQPEPSDSGRGERATRVPIDETQAWEVLGLLFANDSTQARKFDLPAMGVCATSPSPPGRSDLYQRGEITIVFQYDEKDRLVSVAGASGIFPPDIGEPPN